MASEEGEDLPSLTATHAARSQDVSWGTMTTQEAVNYTPLEEILQQIIYWTKEGTHLEETWGTDQFCAGSSYNFQPENVIGKNKCGQEATDKGTNDNTSKEMIIPAHEGACLPSRQHMKATPLLDMISRTQPTQDSSQLAGRLSQQTHHKLLLRNAHMETGPHLPTRKTQFFFHICSK